MFVETSSLVILEAMQFGLPIIASATGAIPELLLDGEDALLFPPRNKEVLVEKLDYLFSDATVMNRLGKTAKKNFLKKYTLDKYRDSLQGIFNEVLDG